MARKKNRTEMGSDAPDVPSDALNAPVQPDAPDSASEPTVETKTDRPVAEPKAETEAKVIPIQQGRLFTAGQFAQRAKGNRELVRIFAKLHQAENRTVKRTESAWQTTYDVWLKEKR